MVSNRVWYYGSEQDLPQRTALRAGPLTLSYEDGGLRYIRLGEQEVLRRIYVAVRDRNWGTVAAAFSNLQVEAGERDFHVAFQAVNRQGEIHFAWQGDIRGDEQGRITFTMEGVALTTFWRNRIGFCVLHPASLAGAPCRVTHVDGTQESATLPELISPEQPVPPFGEMQALTHQVKPGAWAEVRFEGDIFEMEDQRNWTDASFKTFSTPLRLPYPVLVPAGTRIRQSIQLSIQIEQPSAEIIVQPARSERRSKQPPEVTFSLIETPPIPLPPLGLGCASNDLPLTAGEIERLKRLRLDHLRLDLDLSAPADGRKGWQARLERAVDEAGRLGIRLEMALLLPLTPAAAEPEQEQARAALHALRQALERLRPPVSTWLVYPRAEAFTGGSPTREAVRLARQALHDYDPAIPFAAGTNTDLIFMLRTPPPLDLLERVTFALNPQVHTFDNDSLVETLEAQPAAVKTAQRLAGSLPVMISPVTLKPRFNPYATAAEPEPAPGQLPPQVDPRQMSLFGAGWTLGCLKNLAQAGACSLTLFETTGWRGVMETEQGSPLPAAFASIPAGVFPLYHVLAALGGFKGGRILPSASSHPLRMSCLALRQDGRICLLLANHTSSPLRVALPALGKSPRVRLLDENNAAAAMRLPEAFLEQPGEQARSQAGALRLELPPYAVAWAEG